MLAHISNDPDLGRLLSWAEKKLSKDPGHDLAHSLRVADNILKIDESIPPRMAVAAALLHDIVNLPKNSPERSKASEKSAAVAASILPKHGFCEEEVTLICRAITTHSFSRGLVPDSPLGDALQDADRLEALGALGLMRTISTGARMGARYFHASDPWAEQRDYDDLKFTIDHFFTKLLTLPDTMRTAFGRQEARRRRDYMLAFLTQLAHELDHPMPESE